MKKIKKKIYSIISSLLVSNTLISKVPKVKAMYVDDEKDEEMEDELNFSKEDEFDELDGGQEKSEGWLDYFGNHPWETAGIGVGIYSFYQFASWLYDSLRSPSEKTWDEITNELITKHLANKEQNKSKPPNAIPNKDKKTTIINILKDISVNMSRVCSALGCLGSLPAALINAKNVAKDVFYYKIRGSYKNSDESLVRKGLERKKWLCYYVAITLKKCCDKLGLPSTIGMNYTGHTFALVNVGGDVLFMEALTGKCYAKESRCDYYSVAECYWYNTNIIYGKNNKCYRLVENQNDDNTSNAKKIFVENWQRVAQIMNDIIEGNDVSQNPNVKEVPLGTKPLNYRPPAAYIDMLRMQ